MVNLDQFFDEHIAVMRDLAAHQTSIISEMADRCVHCLLNEGTLFFCGNGGSAADSQHLAAELVGRFYKNRSALRSVALTTDTSVLTCIANDFSYGEIFSRQVEALGRRGDMLIAISTSGQSDNVLRALSTAKEMGLQTAALLGKGGGVAKELADCAVVIESDSTARIQEAHIFIGHALCALIEQGMGFV